MYCDLDGGTAFFQNHDCNSLCTHGSCSQHGTHAEPARKPRGHSSAIRITAIRSASSLYLVQMSSPTRQNREAHEEPKNESPELIVGSQIVNSKTGRGEKRKTSTITRVIVESGQEFAPGPANIQGSIEPCTKEEEDAESSGVLIQEEKEKYSTVGPGTAVPPHTPNANIIPVERAPRTRGAVSRGKLQSHASLKVFNFLRYTVLITTVLWCLLRIYPVPSLYLSHWYTLLFPPKTLTPELSPWTDILSLENDMFDHLLKDMVDGYDLSMDVRAARMKITDLRSLIRPSTSGKAFVVNDLTSLLSEAKKSGKGLQSFATNIGRSLDRIMTVNDWALQRIKRGLPPNTMETSINSDFVEAIHVFGKSLQVMGIEVENNFNSLRNIDKDLKTVLRGLGGESTDLQVSAFAHHPTPPTKQVESCLQGLKDIERYVDHATYVIGSAYSVIRDTKRQLEAIRGRLLWERLSWSASAEDHTRIIAVGLENLEEKKARAKSAREMSKLKVYSVGPGSGPL